MTLKLFRIEKCLKYNRITRIEEADFETVYKSQMYHITRKTFHVHKSQYVMEPCYYMHASVSHSLFLVIYKL